MLLLTQSFPLETSEELRAHFRGQRIKGHARAFAIGHVAEVGGSSGEMAFFGIFATGL